MTVESGILNSMVASAIQSHLTLDAIRVVSKMNNPSLELTRDALISFLNGRKVSVGGSPVFVPSNRFVRWAHYAIHLFKCLSPEYRHQFQKATGRIYSLLNDSQELPITKKIKILNINHIKRCFRRVIHTAQKKQEQAIEHDRLLAQDETQAEADRKTAEEAATAVKIKEILASLDNVTVQMTRSQRTIIDLREQIKTIQDQPIEGRTQEGLVVTKESLNKKKLLLQAYNTYSPQLARTKDNLGEVSQLTTNLKTIGALQKAIRELEPKLIAEFGQECIRKDRLTKVSLGVVGKPFELIGVEEKISLLEGLLNVQNEAKQKQLHSLEQQLTAEEACLQKCHEDKITLEKSLEDLKKQLRQPAVSLSVSVDDQKSLPPVAQQKVSNQITSVEKEASFGKKPQELVIDDFKKRGLNHVVMVFEAIFLQCPDLVQSWTVNAKGEFQLQLKEPIRLWIPSEENLGGVVIQIGANEKNFMNGRFEDTTHPSSKQLDAPTEELILRALKESANAPFKELSREQMTPKGVKLETGFYFCCHTNNRIMGISDKIHVSHLLELQDSKLLFIAGMLNIYQGRIRDAISYQQLLQFKGKPVPRGFSSKEFIKKSPRN